MIYKMLNMWTVRNICHFLKLQYVVINLKFKTFHADIVKNSKTLKIFLFMEKLVLVILKSYF